MLTKASTEAVLLFFFYRFLRPPFLFLSYFPFEVSPFPFFIFRATAHPRWLRGCPSQLISLNLFSLFSYRGIVVAASSCRVAPPGLGDIDDCLPVDLWPPDVACIWGGRCCVLRGCDFLGQAAALILGYCVARAGRLRLGLLMGC